MNAERLTLEERVDLILTLEDFIAHLELMDYMAWTVDASPTICRNVYGAGAM